MTEAISGPDMRDLRVISGPVWDGSWRVIFELILDPFWTHSGPILGNLIEYPYFSFIWPWVGP